MGPVKIFHNKDFTFLTPPHRPTPWLNPPLWLVSKDEIKFRYKEVLFCEMIYLITVAVTIS